MKMLHLSAAFTARAPSSVLSSRASMSQAQEVGGFSNAMHVLHESSLTMGEGNFIGATGFNSQIISDTTTAIDGVLSIQDIVVGIILAFALAFGWSFLNGQSSSTSFVSWPSQTKNSNDTIDITNSVKGSGVGDDDINKIFNEDNWKEMSREENYVLYNTKIRQKKNEMSEKKPALQSDKENRLVLIALLVLFVPIFSVEFFFALSRLFICEMGVGGGELVNKLCSPILFGQ